MQNGSSKIPHVDAAAYEFSPEELNAIEKHKAKYPNPQSAVMPALWLAQEKFGWLSEGAIQLVAKTLNLAYAHVYGVATFYTMYLKRPMGKYLFDVCTCLTCGVCGGMETYEYIRKKINADENGVSPEGIFGVREAECLGACDTAPVLMLNNRRYLHKLTPEKIDRIIEDLRKDKMPEFEPIPLMKQ